MPKAEPSTNHNILREPSSTIVLSFTYQASFYIFLYSFSESSAKPAAIVYKPMRMLRVLFVAEERF